LLLEDGINAEVVNMRVCKPLDETCLRSLAQRIQCLVTIEDNVVQGGFGSGVLETLSRLGISNVSVKLLGLPDEFIQHGTPEELYRMVRLDPRGIADATKEFLTTTHRNHAVHTT